MHHCSYRNIWNFRSSINEGVAAQHTLMILWCISIYLIKVNPGSLKTLFFQRGLCDFVDLTRCPLANFRSMRVRLSTFKYMYRDKQHVLQTVDTNNVHDLTQKRSINHAENEELTHFFLGSLVGRRCAGGAGGPRISWSFLEARIMRGQEFGPPGTMGARLD